MSRLFLNPFQHKVFQLFADFSIVIDRQNRLKITFYKFQIGFLLLHPFKILFQHLIVIAQIIIDSGEFVICPRVKHLRRHGSLEEGPRGPVIGRADMARPEGIALPWTALAAKGGAPAVWIVDPAQMTVALAPVTVAEYGVDTVLVSDGVAPGAQVVADGAHLLFPGRSVIARGVSQ